MRSTGSSCSAACCCSAWPISTRFSKALLVIAVAFGTINIVGGFLVTDRMLDMFKSRPKPKSADNAASTPGSGGQAGSGGQSKSDGGSSA